MARRLSGLTTTVRGPPLPRVPQALTFPFVTVHVLGRIAASSWLRNFAIGRRSHPMLQRLWLRAVAGGFLVATVGAGLPAMVKAQTAPVINACVSKSTGIVRIVPDGTRCQRNETVYQWNVQGPAGPAGGTGLTVIAEDSAGGGAAELTEGENYLYAGKPITAARNLLCSVSVTVGLSAAPGGGRDEPQPTFQIAVKLGGDAGVYPQWAGYVPKLTETGGSTTMSRHRWVDVYTDQTVQFGAQIGGLTGDWVAAGCAIWVQYVCFER
jgi:hypothetical protein